MIVDSGIPLPDTVYTLQIPQIPVPRKKVVKRRRSSERMIRSEPGNKKTKCLRVGDDIPPRRTSNFVVVKNGSFDVRCIGDISGDERLYEVDRDHKPHEPHEPHEVQKNLVKIINIFTVTKVSSYLRIARKLFRNLRSGQWTFLGGDTDFTDHIRVDQLGKHHIRMSIPDKTYEIHIGVHNGILWMLSVDESGWCSIDSKLSTKVPDTKPRQCYSPRPLAEVSTAGSLVDILTYATKGNMVVTMAGSLLHSSWANGAFVTSTLTTSSEYIELIGGAIGPGRRVESIVPTHVLKLLPPTTLHNIDGTYKVNGLQYQELDMSRVQDYDGDEWVFDTVLSAHILLGCGTTPLQVLCSIPTVSSDRTVYSLGLLGSNEHPGVPVPNLLFADNTRDYHDTSHEQYQGVFLNGARIEKEEFPVRNHNTGSVKETGQLSLVINTQDPRIFRGLTADVLMANVIEMLLTDIPGDVHTNLGPNFTSVVDDIMMVHDVVKLTNLQYHFMHWIITAGSCELVQYIMEHPILDEWNNDTVRLPHEEEFIDFSDLIASGAPKLPIRSKNLDTLPLLVRLLLPMCVMYKPRYIGTCEVFYTGIRLPWYKVGDANHINRDHALQYPVLWTLRQYIDKQILIGHPITLLRRFECAEQAIVAAGECLKHTTLVDHSDLMPRLGDIVTLVKYTVPCIDDGTTPTHKVLRCVHVPSTPAYEYKLHWDDHVTDVLNTSSIVSPTKVPVVLLSASLDLLRSHVDTVELLDAFIQTCLRRCGIRQTLLRVIADLLIYPYIRPVDRLLHQGDTMDIVTKLLEYKGT